jgi:hypothetical protein
MNAKTAATVSHNVRAYNRAMDKVAAAQTDACPKCGGNVSAELLAIWGHCFTCQKASQAATYGF